MPIVALTRSTGVSAFRRIPMRRVKLPLYITWRQLKELLGWPYSRPHTWRMMFEDKYALDPFPHRGKVGTYHNSHPLWYTPAVLDYLKRHGLPVPNDIELAWTGD
jgi:hypothetical protein